MDSTPQEQACAKLQEHIRTNQQPPELHLLKENEIRFMTDIMLQIKQEPSPEQKTPEKGKETHKCQTCQYEGEQEHHLTRHRRKKTKCKLLWEQEQKQGWKCKIQTCKEVFKTKQELEKHKACHNHEEQGKKNAITSQGIIKLDRRKPLQEGTPRENILLYNNNIRYETEQKRWTCLKCSKTYGPNSMRNAIQHARNHIITGNPTPREEQWHEWTEEKK